MSYLQLAHNERHPDTGAPTAKVIHSFGRADTVDRAALARLVSSISRFLDPEQAATAAGVEVEVLDSRRLGGAWVLDRLWERLGIGAAIRRVAAGRKVDGELAERVIFALVAQRALEPGSKLACTTWVAQRVFIEHLAGFSDDAAYRAMDFLLDALDEIAGEVFASVATLLNLDIDLVFVDSTSTYWEVDVWRKACGVIFGRSAAWQARASSSRRAWAETRRPWWVRRKSTGAPVRGCGSGRPGVRRAAIRSRMARVSSSRGTIRSVASLPSGTFSQAPCPSISCTQSSCRSRSSPMRQPVARVSSRASACSRASGVGPASDSRCRTASSRRSASGGR